MTKDRHIEARYDLVIAGFGPSGAVAAAMFGRLGHSVLVIDRLTDIYDKPRAIALDHEILRHFDNMGIAEEVLPYVAPFTASEHFGAEGQLIRRIDMVPAPYPLGYTPSMVFTQPPVEAALRHHAESLKTVTVELGTELIGFTDHGDEVTVELKNAEGHVRMVAAKYLIGCDGASSTVRQNAGIVLEDLIFDEPWLVVDVKVHDNALDKLPASSAQFCNPARPVSFIIGPGNHRRWEIMLLPGEDRREMEKPENVWTLLSPWLTPEDGELWRAASYRFHALVADEWKKGRVLIAGDAAHQQPPFIGQGMCQGLRDVTNLVWKLDRVLKGLSPEALLDSYTEERKRHVETLTGKIKAIGQAICIRDPEAAAERDQRILTEGGGKPLMLTRQDIVPPLETGLIGPPESAARGLLFPQPVIIDGEATVLLDKVIGTGWRLLLDGRRLDHKASDILLDGLPEMSVTAVLPKEKADAGEGLHEADGVLAAWFDRHKAMAAIVRPDHYVFGAAADIAALNGLLTDLKTRLH
ncbi:bifunctional 3-(3-hydroxy-phenyl)propionate/3-hydroxycinnamic acid hydroxylase [Allorhizobium sp. BGMRC 0089]|uniref:bifunctional 3-(3-hydroxy-phenyl)propionate/3-hydroxycinnamic acid hydroxylase n=1 Tax=Allorhizobium sonneratiae TaxID=2934936 RepID=UPI002033617C|nr:bifunctional 3-(3-hydroxy-phenyl)propionate/3-hydroxycinnamic acid hydroxylase [Allorhizobium sonneratiae]